MTMFNSQKINNDPKPHIDGHGNRFDAPFTHSLLAGCGEPCDTKHAPRPEFDNNPNPILEALRTAREHSVTGSPIREVAAEWLESGVLAQLGAPVEWGHVLHARKVLERLARLA